MTVEVKAEIRGIEKVQDYLATLKRGQVKVVLLAIGEWLIGTPQRGLKHYQPYKYVPIRKAGGFKSDKQRRFVMAMIREGKIDPGVPHRTGNTQRAWHLDEGSNGYKPVIVNATKGALYTRSDTLQSKLNALAGWRKVSDIISTNIAGAIRHAQAAINELIRKKGNE